MLCSQGLHKDYGDQTRAYEQSYDNSRRIAVVEQSTIAGSLLLDYFQQIANFVNLCVTSGPAANCLPLKMLGQLRLAEELARICLPMVGIFEIFPPLARATKKCGISKIRTTGFDSKVQFLLQVIQSLSRVAQELRTVQGHRAFQARTSIFRRSASSHKRDERRRAKCDFRCLSTATKCRNGGGWRRQRREALIEFGFVWIIVKRLKRPETNLFASGSFLVEDNK